MANEMWLNTSAISMVVWVGDHCLSEVARKPSNEVWLMFRPMPMMENAHLPDWKLLSIKMPPNL